MSQMIKESESVQESFNNFMKKSKFLDINSIYSNESQKQFFFLLYYDAEFSDMSILYIICRNSEIFLGRKQLIYFRNRIDRFRRIFFQVRLYNKKYCFTL